MPRDGSPGQSGGPQPPAPMNIGEVANPPFAVLPDPTRIFETRAARFDAVATGHQLEPYIRFLADVARAQHRVQAELQRPALPLADRLATAFQNGMPPISAGQVELNEVADLTLSTLARHLATAAATAESKAAIARIAAASTEEGRGMMQAVLLDLVPRDDIAAHVLAAAALQVHLTRLAAQLGDVELTRIADGACPACGSAPVASCLVPWEGAHGTRFCTCSMCSTQWHVVRVKCLVCSNEKGISYQSLEGGPETIMGETCEACTSYVKMLHRNKDASLELFADDVASLALDMTLQREGWQRASVNPFLMGY